MSSAPLPPGPPSPWWGLLHVRDMARDFLGFMAAQQRQYGDVVLLRVPRYLNILLFHPDHVRDALVHSHDALIRWERGAEVFAEAHGQSVLVVEGEAWKQRRKLMQPGFSPRRVEAFVPLMTSACEEALQAWPAQAAFELDFEAAMTALTMDVILRSLFSSRSGEESRAAAAAVHDISIEGQSEMFWPASLPDWLPWKGRKRRALRTLDGLIRGHVAARAGRQEGEDLLAMLMQLGLTGETLRDECMTTFLAGHETSATALTWWAWCMAAHPEAQERAQAELAPLQGRTPVLADMATLPWLTQTIKEALRLYPPAPALLSRRALETFEVGGYQVPRGALLLLAPGLIQRDARWFPEPEAFRPERFAPDAPEIPRGSWMPFGAGPRVCLGQHFAMTEITLVAAMLLQRFRLAPAPGAAPPRPTLNITLRPATPLRLSLARR
ncbi:MAG: cytochrome P450 [Paucibacter sp.]|nr:cytochrome P450 [Roseateles sp.]